MNPVITTIFIFTILLGTNPALANQKCQKESEEQAVEFVVDDAQVEKSEINVLESFFVEVFDDIIYYGVSVEVDGFTLYINVGLNEKDCSLAHTPNYVTDPSDF